MPDPFRKVRPNERVEFSATAWNAMLAAGQAQLNHQFDSGSNGTSQIRQSGIIRVRNDSGIDLNRNSVLGLDSPIFLPSDSEDAFLREVCFGASVPTADHRGRFCILLEPVLDGRIARAWVAGVCPVLVDVSDGSHTSADIEAGETLSLVSGGGSAQILWREGLEEAYGYDTGLQWAIIRFGGAASGIKIARSGGSGVPGRVDDLPGSADVTEYTFDGTILSAGSTYTAYNLAAEAVGTEKWIITTGIGSHPFVTWEECEASAEPAPPTPPPGIAEDQPSEQPGGPIGAAGSDAILNSTSLPLSDIPGTST